MTRPKSLDQQAFPLTTTSQHTTHNSQQQMSSSHQAEPSLTFHPEGGRRSSVIPHIPDIQSLAAGAHFNATSTLKSQMSDGDAGSLKRTSSRLAICGVQLEGKRKQVLEDVLDLYCLHPTPEIFQRSWREDSVFEDPSTTCTGYKEVAAQFYSAGWSFSKARTLHVDVLRSTTGPSEPNQIVHEQSHEYVLRLIGTKRTVTSLITIDLDEEDRIVKLTDKWPDTEKPSRFNTHYMRRLMAKTATLFVSVPKYRV